MKANELKNDVDRAYARRMDAQTRSVRDEIAEIPAHPYDDWSVDDCIDPALFNGLVAGKGNRYLNFRRKGHKKQDQEYGGRF